MLDPTKLSSEFTYIDSVSQLQSILNESSCRSIGIDTEFARSDTFYPRLGLLQLQLDDQTYLVDPLTVDDFSALSALFQDDSICFVFHACGEDLEVLNFALGAYPKKLLDTQIAAAYAGYGSQLGYQALLKQLCDIDIPKEQTRSDWMKRPLTQEQQIYAALDVQYLPKITQLLTDKLTDLGRWQWVEEECDMLVRNACRSVAAEDYYLTFNNAWQLKPRQLQILKNLAHWREDKCQEVDKPRSFVMKDATLFWVVENLPKTKKSLAQAPGMKGKAVGVFGDEIISRIQKGMLEEQESLPSPERPLSKKLVPLLKDIKAIANGVAEELGIPPEWVLRKRWIQELVISYGDAVEFDEEWQIPEAFNGWRKAKLLPSVEACLDKNKSLLSKYYRPSR